MTLLAILDILIRGAGISACLFFCAILLPHGIKAQAVWRGILYGIGVSAYFIWSAPWYNILPDEIQAASLTLTLYNPLLFWLAVRALFNDATSFTRAEVVVSGIYSVVVFVLLVSIYVNAAPATDIGSVVFRITAFVLVLHGMSELVRQYEDDLLNPRRRMRVYLTGILGLYFIVLFVVRLIFPDAQPPDVFLTLNAFIVTILAIANNFVNVKFRSELLPPNRPYNPAEKITRTSVSSDKKNQHSELIAKVIGAMENDHMYREETLSVQTLAQALGAQEYLLRRAINRGLGHRNFSQFLNSYRLSEIRSALCDPGKSHLPILTIAYDAGFNSIGPFNRAFKHAYGFRRPS